MVNFDCRRLGLKMALLLGLGPATQCELFRTIRELVEIKKKETLKISKLALFKVKLTFLNKPIERLAWSLSTTINLRE